MRSPTARGRVPRCRPRPSGRTRRAAGSWGDDDDPSLANRWVGEFPWRGYRGTSPVGAFPANGYGLFDMTGNVWEWTATPFAEDTDGCHGPPVAGIARQVIKGGSHL